MGRASPNPNPTVPAPIPNPNPLSRWRSSCGASSRRKPRAAPVRVARCARPLWVAPCSAYTTRGALPYNLTLTPSRRCTSYCGTSIRPRARVRRAAAGSAAGRRALWQGAAALKLAHRGSRGRRTSRGRTPTDTTHESVLSFASAKTTKHDTVQRSRKKHHAELLICHLSPQAQDVNRPHVKP